MVVPIKLQPFNSDQLFSRPPLSSEGGIPNFVADDFYYGEIPQEEMRRFLRAAEQISVAAAIDQVLIPNSPQGTWLKNYIIDDSRADWRFLLEPNPDGVVLDLGCGYGAISLGLADLFGTVVAADPTYERVKTTALRARDLGVANLVPVRVNALDLPFHENVFDGAVMMGVLEWVGEGQPGSVRKLQLRVLRDLFKTVKPGGFLALGIENRFGYNYVLGEEDEHSHLKFTTLLPRWLASLVMQLRQHKLYRTYTYSMNGYRRLLSEAGFSEINYWGAIPKYRYPDYVIDFSRPEPLQYYIEKVGGKSRLKRLGFRAVAVLHRLGIWKHFFPSFIIVCRKSESC